MGFEAAPRPMRLSAKPVTTTTEVDDIRRAAAMLGRWFGNQGAPVQILQTMGVTP